jgi:hypothetical protein
MYSNPHNILSIEKPAIGEVVPKLVIKKAWLRFNQRYHPDRWVSNGFSHEATAAAAFEIGRLAEISLTKYHNNPYCDNSTRLYRNFDAGHEVVGLPHFARDCVCSASYAARQAISALMSTLLLHSPPTSTSLAEFCPCDFERIEAFRKTSKDAYNKIGPPPPLARIYYATPWDPFPPRAFDWKVRMLFGSWTKNNDHEQSDEDRQRWEKEG